MSAPTVGSLFAGLGGIRTVKAYDVANCELLEDGIGTLQAMSLSGYSCGFLLIYMPEEDGDAEGRLSEEA